MRTFVLMVPNTVQRGGNFWRGILAEDHDTTAAYVLAVEASL